MILKPYVGTDISPTGAMQFPDGVTCHALGFQITRRTTNMPPAITSGQFVRTGYVSDDSVYLTVQLIYMDQELPTAQSVDFSWSSTNNDWRSHASAYILTWDPKTMMYIQPT